VLVLAGTSEATDLAGRLDRAGVEVISSLAGVTATPRVRAGRARSGGFGGTAGLVGYLRNERIDALVDATHPFAAVMPFHAADACAYAGVAHCRLLRAPWVPEPGDRWTGAADLVAAAAILGRLEPRRVFLAIGRQSAPAFRRCRQHWFLARSIEPLATPLANCIEVRGRGPFEFDAEVALLLEHRIDLVVTKNAGGVATVAKLAAARSLGLEVVMVERPAAPVGVVEVATDEEACRWVEATVRGAGGGYIPTSPGPGL